MKLKYLLAILAILLFVAFIELSFGRNPICECGYIKLWTSLSGRFEDSQHLTDWYTFSHIIHGFIFYYLSKLIFKKLTPFQRFLLALVVEASWEIFENSNFMINRYQDSTISQQYFGDSIINSISDILAMTFGFFLATKLPTKIIIILIILMEFTVGYFIRDNLTLNIIMLVYPSEAIKNWQLGRSY
jgi:hypothetical protein